MYIHVNEKEEATKACICTIPCISPNSHMNQYSSGIDPRLLTDTVFDLPATYQIKRAKTVGGPRFRPLTRAAEVIKKVDLSQRVAIVTGANSGLGEHPSTHSPLHALTPSHTHPSTHSPLHALTPPHTHPSTHSPLHILTAPHTHPSTHTPSHTHRSTHSPLHALTPPLTHPSTHSPLHALTPPRIHPSTHSLLHTLTPPHTHSVSTGFRTALHLADRGAHVILACRHMTRASTAVAQIQKQVVCILHFLISHTYGTDTLTASGNIYIFFLPAFAP